MSHSTKPPPLLKTTLCLLMLGMSQLSPAASLGRMNVQSALGESFRAEVELLNVSGDEASNLVARTASPDTFRRQGVDYNPALINIKTSLVTDGSRNYITLRSNEGLQEPLLEILIEISSDKGSFIKKYTVLLDPPLSNQTATELAAQLSIVGAAKNYAPNTLSLKPSFNLSLQNVNPSAQAVKRTTGLNKRERLAQKKALRKSSKDTLSVYSPTGLDKITGKQTPQSLARQLVKSGINDPAQIEALINALNAAKVSSAPQAMGVPLKPDTKTANQATTAVSTLPPAEKAKLPANNLNTQVPSTGAMTTPTAGAAVVQSSPLTTAPVNGADLPPASPTAAVPAANAPANQTPAATVATPAAATTPPVAAASPPSNSLWLDALSSTWFMILAALSLLGLLIWSRLRQNKTTFELDSFHDYKPMKAENSPQKAGTLKSVHDEEKPIDTKFFESKFLTEIMTEESAVQATDVEPIGHAKQMIAQGEKNNALSILKDLINDSPSDQSVRLMLITLLIDKQDDVALDEQMSQLEKTSQSTGSEWDEANRLYSDYKLKQKALLDFTETEVNTITEPLNSEVMKAEPPATTSDDFPTLTLDLTRPTSFSPPAQPSLTTMDSLEFDFTKPSKKNP